MGQGLGGYIRVVLEERLPGIGGRQVGVLLVYSVEPVRAVCDMLGLPLTEDNCLAELTEVVRHELIILKGVLRADSNDGLGGPQSLKAHRKAGILSPGHLLF